MQNINVKKWTGLINHTYTGYQYHKLDMKYVILLVLSCLHHEKKISDAKLKGQFQALRKGTLQRKKNTYHCTINNSWYNDENITEIWGGPSLDY